jgi:hypothetical protein
MIAERTKLALAAAKARGVKLAIPSKLRPSRRRRPPRRGAARVRGAARRRRSDDARYRQGPQRSRTQALSRRRVAPAGSGWLREVSTTASGPGYESLSAAFFSARYFR